MQRTAAGADPKPVGRRDRRADVSLGIAYRLAELLSLRQTRGDGRRQSAAGAVGVAWWRYAARQSAHNRPLVTKRSTLSGPPPWPPLISTAPGRARAAFVCLRAHFRFRRAPAACRAAPPPRNIGRQQVAYRTISSRNALDRIGAQTISRPNSPPAPDQAPHCASPVVVERRSRTARSPRIADHADLHRGNVEIGEHRVDLRGDEISTGTCEWPKRPWCSAP